MSLGIVIDPVVFNYEYYNDESYCDNANIFFKEMRNCVLIIVDEKDSIKNDIDSKMKTLKEKILSEEIKITPRRKKAIENWLIWYNTISRSKIIKSRYRIPKAEQGNISVESLYSVKKESRAVTLVTNDDKIHYLEEKEEINELDCTSLKSYIYSSFETEREWYVANKESINKLPYEKIERFIKYVVQYTNKITIYDKIIGRKSDQEGIDPFRLGIQSILKHWKEGYSYNKDSQVEILTCINKRFNNGTSLTEKKEKNKNIFYNIVKYLVKPLEKKGFSVKLRIIDDHGGMRLRFLQTDNIILEFSEGFDLFEKKVNKYLANTISVNNYTADYLNDFLKIKPIYQYKWPLETEQTI